jgi:hypothetical protein
LACVLLGLHQFPVIAFYTMDGLLLVGSGWLLIQRAIEERSTRQLVVGFALLGVASTVKQSFWFAPLVAFSWLLIALYPDRGALLRHGTRAIAACAAAPLAYLAFVTAGGGFSEMRAELSQTTPVWGGVLLDQIRQPDLRRTLLPSLVVFTVLVAVARLARGQVPEWVNILSRVGATGIVLRLALQEDLVFNGEWSQRLFWCAVAAACVSSISRRTIDPVGICVLAIAWMVTLSWGSPTPALASGALAAYIADTTWRGAPASVFGRRTRPLYALGAIVAAGVVAGYTVNVRTDNDYGVLRGNETYTLGGALSGVHMDATSYNYLHGVQQCVAKYPAKWVAVVPEGALAYATFGLRNPFPIDWFWPADYTGAGGRQRLIDAATSTNRRGNYLVLFQTSPYGSPPDPGSIKSFAYDPSLGQEIASRLTRARRTPCSQFVAFYDPAK